MKKYIFKKIDNPQFLNRVIGYCAADKNRAPVYKKESYLELVNWYKEGGGKEGVYDSILKTTPMRFVLALNEKGTDFELIFGASDEAGAGARVHSKMSENSVLAAGEVFFDDEGKLTAINNKSGHYKPSFDTLQFALDQFKAEGIPVSDKLNIGEWKNKIVYQQVDKKFIQEDHHNFKEDYFFQKIKKKVLKQYNTDKLGLFGFLRETTVNEINNLEDLINHGIKHSLSRTNKILKELGFLDTKNQLTALEFMKTNSPNDAITIQPMRCRD